MFGRKSQFVVSLWSSGVNGSGQVLVLTLQESARCCATAETFSSMERSLDWVAWEMRATVSIDTSVTPNFLAEMIQSLVLKLLGKVKKKKKRVEKRFFGPGAPNQLKDKYYCFPSQTCLMIWPNLTSKHFTGTLSICHTHTLTSHHSLHIISSRWRNAPPPCSLLQPSSWNHHTHTHTRRTPPEEDLHF